MTKENKTPGIPAMLAIFLLPACFLLPSGADNYLLFTSGLLFALLPEGAVLLIIGAVFSKRPVPRVISLPLAVFSGVFFIVCGVFSLRRFLPLTERFSSYYIGSGLLLTLLLFSAVYIASLSDGAIGRLCSAVLFLTLGLYSLTVLMALKNGTATALHLSSPSPYSDIEKGLISGLLILEPDVYFLMICLNSKGAHPSPLRFLLAKGGIILLFTLPVIYVLGEHIHYSALASYDLAAYSKSVIIERFNGLFMGLMTIAAVTRAAVELHAVKLTVNSLQLTGNR